MCTGTLLNRFTGALVLCVYFPLMSKPYPISILWSPLESSCIVSRDAPRACGKIVCPILYTGNARKLCFSVLFCFSNRVACRPNENKILPFIGFIRFDQICELVENKREGLRTLVGKIARWNRVFTVYAFSMVSSTYARLVILSFFFSVVAC